MFEKSLNKFLDYRKRCFDKQEVLSGYDAEIGHKIMQLNWIIFRAQKLNDSIIAASNTGAPASEEFSELEILSESFYHFTGRLVELFRHNPNFGNIPNSGAENVRHQLLQHPEKQKDRQKSSPCFECGSKDGPKIKSYTGTNGALVDAGLFVNASEFNDKLIIVFDRKKKQA